MNLSSPKYIMTKPITIITFLFINFVIHAEKMLQFSIFSGIKKCRARSKNRFRRKEKNEKIMLNSLVDK
jgi:hypothetical protein